MMMMMMMMMEVHQLLVSDVGPKSEDMQADTAFSARPYSRILCKERVINIRFKK
jgi:hypothetical protein